VKPTVALNIKSSEARRMAQELAEARGTSLTEAVTAALAASLEAEKGVLSADLLLAEVAEIQAFVAALPDLDARSPEEILGYDERGLPV
jgi:antitoxin VapB